VEIITTPEIIFTAIEAELVTTLLNLHVRFISEICHLDVKEFIRTDMNTIETEIYISHIRQEDM